MSRILVAAFTELRRRSFPLGLAEYLDVLRALDAGFGVGSRESLTEMCQSIWAHSPAERDEVAEVLHAILPVPGKHRRRDRDEPAVPDEIAREPVTGTVTEAVHGAGEVPVAYVRDERRRATERSVTRAEKPWSFDTEFDLAGSLPVTSRQMMNSWRRYRIMQRGDRAEDFDLDATIRDYSRTGFLVAAMAPRRTNQARLLMLVDSSLSMLPFLPLTEKLVETPARAGFAEYAAYSFVNTVACDVVDVREGRRPASVQAVIDRFAGAGVVVYSDAGAARGTLSEERVRRTVAFLESVRERAAAVVWLNPMPEDRWVGTTAQEIRQGSRVDMVGVDRDGLDAAVAVLRGRTAS